MNKLPFWRTNRLFAARTTNGRAILSIAGAGVGNTRMSTTTLLSLGRRGRRFRGPSQRILGAELPFFRFSLAKLGYRIVCSDIDHICGRDLALARELVPHAPGTVDFRLIEGATLPFQDSECDVICCISVLEHIPDFAKTIAEMARILKPGGLCLITCDINLRPEDDLQLDVAHYEQLRSLIGEAFHTIWPEHTIHPSDLLTTLNSSYPVNTPTAPGIARMAARFTKQRILKPLLGREPGKIDYRPPHLAVLGLVLQKRSRAR